MEKELQWLNSGRVTTDTAHRRFQKDQNDRKENGSKAVENREDYFCEECNIKISSKGGHKLLKEHFDHVKHLQYENCVYCSKPAFFYIHKNKTEVCHSC